MALDLLSVKRPPELEAFSSMQCASVRTKVPFDVLSRIIAGTLGLRNLFALIKVLFQCPLRRN